MGKQIEELQAQVKQLAAQLELSVAAERAWETTMMQVCGEDGVGSVADKFKQLAAENAALKELIEQHSSCVAVCPNCSHETPSETDDIVALYRSMSTPATDAILASLRAEAITDALENGSGYLDTDCVMDRHDISYQDAELRAAGAMELRDSLVAGAKQLRSKSEVQS
ncbi:TPA: hypothetical protein ACG33R_001175 [Escherichia coli]